jgi:hypothetical protein
VAAEFFFTWCAWLHVEDAFLCLWKYVDLEKSYTRKQFLYLRYEIYQHYPLAFSLKNKAVKTKVNPQLNLGSGKINPNMSAMPNLFGATSDAL